MAAPIDFAQQEGPKGTVTSAAVAAPVRGSASGEGDGMTSSSNEELGGGGSTSRSTAAAAAAATSTAGSEQSHLVFVGKGVGYSFDLENLLRASVEMLGKGSVRTNCKRVFFYRPAELVDADVDAIVSNLKRPLSLALGAFLPLAGRLRVTPGTSANRYELRYSPGDDAITFTVAEYDFDVDSLAADEPREVSKLAPLAPKLPAESGAVLAVQATVLKLGGLAVGVTVHHAACDGAASTHFLHTWAAFAAGNGADQPPLPVIDRTLVSDPGGLYDVYFRAVTAAAPSTDNKSATNMATDKNMHLFATFVLSKHLLQRVKDAVAATRAVATSPPRCSSLVAALGLVWSIYHRAKAAAAGVAAAPAEACCLLFTVDHRSRLNSPLPDKYFGNCVGPALATASRTELVETGGAGGLWAACKAITAAIEEAVSIIGTERMVFAKDRVKQAAATTDLLTVAGSPRFKVYALDFGFGPPAKVDLVSVASTGAIAVAESRVDAAGGGIEVGVSLPPDGMAAFRKCFADAIDGPDLDAA